ncbi:MAG: hypothetical protein KGL17_02645 [Betaproteobacteria bacterium]|nr:hypothetical protein [Betaproteobacteria bacterium]MDE1981219.1 hypothetical protein [Betaproteobacteria bacterium]MDE2211371.1 hypothetical protein [Betaproteobacteria bacterium]MDE2353899.1 hypothetical protein [Betaproteobacteria bacterium]MDE2624274.1 hypothetical protein [Betaproteobacteria bacterium]
MSWKFDAPLVTLSDDATTKKNEALWEAEDLGGLTEDNNPVPAPVVWLVLLTVLTAFFVTFPLWGQRPTAALYAPYVNSMDKPEVLAAKDDTEAMQKIVAMNKGTSSDALLERHPLTMDDLRLIKDQIKALETKGVDLRDYTVVGDHVVIANFEGNYRPDGTRIRQQPWWDKGYTIDVFYLSYFFLAVFLMIKRLPPTYWQPRHGHGASH